MKKVTNSYKYRIVLHKTYFDKGWSLLSYFKYVFALVGLGSLLDGYNLSYVIFGSLIYGVVCYFLGRFWLINQWYEEEIEVTNHFNKFVKETREFIKNGNV